MKRTNDTPKRTAAGAETTGIQNLELHSFAREIVACHPSVDTAINTDSYISLASGRTLSKASLFRVLHVGGWTAVGGFVWAFNLADIGPFAAAMEYLIWVAWGLLLTLGLRSIFRRGRASGWSYQTLGALALGLGVLAGPAWYVVNLSTLRAVLAGLKMLGLAGLLAREMAETAGLPQWWPPFLHWLMFTSLLLTWSSLYFGINAMLDLETERTRSVDALKLADGARLRALQSQLNPHFLFNALNGITTLIREGHRARAADTVDTLSDFLRLTLQKLDSPEIFVREELAFVEQYLRIQRLRFGSTFQATVDANPDTYEALVPTLILQPLVENAVRHGVLARAGGGMLSVSIRRRDDVLVIAVEDDGPGIGDRAVRPYGLGFRNTAERLTALYGDEAHMSVGEQPKGRGFVVVVFLPFRRVTAVSSPPRRETVVA